MGKKISIALLLLIVWLLISVFFKPNHLVTNQEIEAYGDTYLQTYRNLVSQFNPNDWSYFPAFVDFWNKTTSINTMVSESHGAGIEFVLNSSLSHFHLMRTNDRIELAVFGGSFYRAGGLPLQIFQIRLIWVLESGVNFETGGQCMFEVLDNATLAVDGFNWTLDATGYFNPITIKGSNMYESWASNKAVWDAEFDFRYDLAYALNQSEGVREYVAYSDLKGLLSNIADRLKNDPNYGWSQLESDLSEVSRIAQERYGVTRPNFIQDVFNAIKEKTALSKKLPVFGVAYDNNYIYTLFFSVLLDLSYIFAISLNQLLRSLSKKSSKPIAKIVKQFGEWFTFILVLIAFFVNAPYGYEMAINLPILIFQLIMIILLSRAVPKLKSEFVSSRRNVAYRLVIGTFSLLLVFAVMLLLLPYFYAVPLMFNTYSIIVGNITAFSVLTASMGVLIVLVLQLVYNRLFGNLHRRV
jgi:hypothetical protein